MGYNFVFVRKDLEAASHGKFLVYQLAIPCMREQFTWTYFQFVSARKVFFVVQSSENGTGYVCVCWPHNHLLRSVLPCNQTGIRKGTSCPYIQENTFHCSSKVCGHKYSSEKKRNLDFMKFQYYIVDFEQFPFQSVKSRLGRARESKPALRELKRGFSLTAKNPTVLQSR